VILPFSEIKIRYETVTHILPQVLIAEQQGALILRLMTQFARDFVASIEGTKVDVSTKELSGGARIYYIFNDIFGRALASIDATHNLENQDIRTAIRNSMGPRPSLFVPEMAFDLLVKPQIKLLEAPSLRCVELVYEELVKMCHNCTNTVNISFIASLPLICVHFRSCNDFLDCMLS
jgi:dynamin 1-like protein